MKRTLLWLSLLGLLLAGCGQAATQAQNSSGLQDSAVMESTTISKQPSRFFLTYKHVGGELLAKGTIVEWACVQNETTGLDNKPVYGPAYYSATMQDVDASLSYDGKTLHLTLGGMWSYVGVINSDGSWSLTDTSSLDTYTFTQATETPGTVYRQHNGTSCHG